MNAARSIAVLVTICIIGPMLLGYCWPTESSEQEQYAVSAGTDITADISNDTVPVFSTYTGMFNYSFINTWGDDSLPDYVGSTTVPGQVPLYDAPEEPDATYTLVPGTPIKVKDLPWPADTVRAFVNWSGGSDVSLDGVDLYWMDCFPQTGQVVWSGGTATADAELTATRLDATIEIYKMDPTDPVTYADLSQGIAVEDSGWYNGFVNSSIRMVLNVGYDTDTEGTFTIVPDMVSVFNALEIVNDGGAITAEVDGDVRAIGDYSVYRYVMIEYDAANGEYTVTGLSGMDSFTDVTWTPGNSETFDVSNLGKTFWGVELDGNLASYLVTATESKIGSRPGIVESTFNPDGFYPDRCWQLYFRDTSVFGDSITLGGTIYSVSKSGEINLTYADGTTEARKIRDMTIMSADSDGTREIYIDNRLLGTFESFDIVFGGSWMMDVLIFDVDVSEQTVYGWEAGGFGLDVQGFAMAGLMIDILAFAALTLYGRGSGARVLPLLIACAIIGAVFFIILVEGF